MSPTLSALLFARGSFVSVFHRWSGLGFTTGGRFLLPEPETKPEKFFRFLPYYKLCLKGLPERL